MSRRHTALIALAATLGLATAALAQPSAAQSGEGQSGESQSGEGPSAEAASTMNIQGEQASWITDPHMHAFYEMTRQAFAGGAAKVDPADYTERSQAIFRAFAVSRGMDPNATVEHLKLIPGQMIQIAREDPQVLASYDNFVAALFGPQ